MGTFWIVREEFDFCLINNDIQNFSKWFAAILHLSGFHIIYFFEEPDTCILIGSDLSHNFLEMLKDNR
ncbi:hypothetical protein Mpal_0887 [Methanosphaerula palustris E1-9c]|uniref:Uncharacterized protein n=1 Tax=Methanosphaerula palustris (strain ATCC BAA-1556 / DSM 19958 / E1-9c) TaxID=521011 RepID=B8GGJ0_METPE|nr:hypothetical protein Mpal_0887 [Methanosphaerula palustris E1-9c]